MLRLPNNCRAGKMSVFPSNWKTVRANASLIWYIKYRFYDDNLKQSRQIVIKGMNDFETAQEKRELTQSLLDQERDLLLHEGYNHITKIYSAQVESDDITRNTYFINALDFALLHIKAGESTMSNLKSCLGYIKRAATELRYDRSPVCEIKTKQVMLLMNRVGKIKKETVLVVGKSGQTKKGVWTSNTFNHYRAHLGMFFRLLKKLEVVDSNYALEIDREKTVRKIRETLTKEQRAIVAAYVYEKDRNFWRYLQCLFHGGAREVELLRIKREHIELSNHRVKVLVKKGKGHHREEYRTIKDLAFDVWQELYDEAKDGQYIFHRGLKPGPSNKPIRTEQVTRRWLRYAKVALGFSADLYSLKHSNLTEVKKELGIKRAQKMAGHSSEKTTKLYLVGEDEIEHLELRSVGNVM